MSNKKTPWLKITQRGKIVYIGEDPKAAIAAMTEAYFVYSCYHGDSSYGPWWFMTLDDMKALGLKVS